MDRPYFSERAGKNGSANLTLSDLRIIFAATYRKYELNGYFQHHFGMNCVDSGYMQGSEGIDLMVALTLRFGGRASSQFPIDDNSSSYELEDIFDLIEYFWDHIAKPTVSHYHDWNDCGIHVEKASEKLGKEEWSKEWNFQLSRLEPQYLITSDGIIEFMPSQESIRQLVNNVKPYGNKEKVDSKVYGAIRLFYSRHSTTEDKRIALKELADVLEFIRVELKDKLPKKEVGELFNIANNYGIRHWNQKQNTDYDKEIYYPWIFHCYLAILISSSLFAMYLPFSVSSSQRVR